MPTYLRYLSAVAAVSLLAATARSAEPEKPNVLFVISDDLNYMLSGLGHPECETPNLDRFAETAVAFSRAYCQFPLCGPSRASIMSGQYPEKNGVTANRAELDLARVTLPKHFQDHGYWTGRVSKIYHMGIPVDIVEGTAGLDHPPSWDVTHNVTALETMTPGKLANYTEPNAHLGYPEDRIRWQKAHSEGRPYEMSATARGQYAVVEVEDADEALLPDTMAADKAISLLQERAGKEEPFFLAVGFVRPHFPFVSTESSLARYDADEIAYPRSPDHDYDDIPPQAINARLDLEEAPVRELRRGYYGAITFMDQQFGRLLAELDRLDLRENTIVVFISDHGYLLGEHQMWKKGKLWEEAIHVPLLISAPGLTDQAQGQVCDRFVELVDLYPTLSELAGLPDDPGAQGLSLVPLLADPSAKRLAKPDALSQVSGGHGLRSDRWAYMWYPAVKKHPASAMLFDMEKDPQQFNNLAEDPAYADVRKRLHRRLLERIEIARGQD